MIILVTVIVLIVAALVVSYWRAPWWAWTLWMAMGAMAVAGISRSWGWTAFALGLALLWVVLFQSPPIRRRWLTGPVFRRMHTLLPQLSATEEQALAAGDVWWEAQFFDGRPDWPTLLGSPRFRLSDEEQAFIDDPVETLCAMLDDWRITHHDRDLPPKVWAYMKQQGFFGMIIPKRYGGLEFSTCAHSQVVLKVASRSITAGVTVMVPNSLGPAELLLAYGTKAQKEHYLPRLARGDDVPCFALTGPRAGSDAGSLPDRGVVCRQPFAGQADVLGIRLNWDKRYITLAPVATVLGLAFKLEDPDGLLGGPRERGITVALIPTDTPGVEIGRRHHPLNAAFQNGPTRGRDVFIPVEWIIGGADQVGQGWRMLMEALAAGRSISLPALSVGAAKVVSRATGAYARVRRQFGQPIGRFEGVQEPLAEIAGMTYQMDAVRQATAAVVDAGVHPSVSSAIAKYQLTERMRKVVNHGMDIHGGSGICMGPRNFLARPYQTLPISITVEGANILTRSMIIFGQGAVRCHPYILKEMQAIKEADARRGLRRFDRALCSHVGFVLSNAVRCLWLGLTGARLSPLPGPRSMRVHFRSVHLRSARFALAADVALLTLGGSLKRREFLSGRFADVLSHLLIATAVLKRHAEQDYPDDERILVRWGCAQAVEACDRALEGILDNLPNRVAALTLRALLYPLGMRRRVTDDVRTHRLAALLLTPSAVRDRLTAGIYQPEESDQTLRRLEHALALAVKADPVEQRIRAAQRQGRLLKGSGPREALQAGVISEDEADLLALAERARDDVIAVDEFDARLDLSPAVTDESAATNRATAEGLHA